MTPHPDDYSGIARTRRARGGLTRVAILVIACFVLLAPATARAAFLSPELARDAQAKPEAAFKVIVQGKGKTSDGVAEDVKATRVEVPGVAVGVKKKFASITGVAAELTGKQILKLADKRGILAITEDSMTMTSGFGLTSEQLWPYASGDAGFWPLTGKPDVQAPAIAIVDSGIDAGRLDFGARVVQQVNLCSLAGNSSGDGRGHGTMVASIAAGSAPGYAGGAPNARLISLDVINDNGTGLTSDVIAAADWILNNKNVYGIRVANFSLHAANPSSFRFDPLDKAVERLWFSGVVVVAASGNYGLQRSGVLYAPANDPFVITVGADDLNGSISAKDDFAAPWSAYGYTLDGFAKPELGAPGRYMVGAVSPTAALALERPDRIVAPGYMQISGTSFAAPVVSAAAAYTLALHPNWSPDQVKGALMATAKPTPAAVPLSNGAGEVWAPAAANFPAPPNPNLALNQFLVADPAGGSLPVFDEATWTSGAQANPSWDAATWTSATWTSATWTSATWTSNSWDAATWTSATWTSATWTSATWTSDVSSGATWTSSAENEGLATGGDWIGAEELLAAQLELGLTP